MSKRTEVRIATVGTGLFGQVHLAAVSQHPSARLVGVCDVAPDRAQAVGTEYGVRAVTDYRKIADDPDIDAVTVATPDFAHTEIVCSMLEAGKHVLVEKPMAVSVEDARRIVLTARRSGRFLMVDFHNRWNPPFADAIEKVDAGLLGEPVAAAARLANSLYVPLKMLSWAGKSGPHWFLFPHIVDLVCRLFRKPVRRVTACGRKGVLLERGIDAWDAIQALAEFEGGGSAVFETAWILPETHPAIVDFDVTLLGTHSRMAFRPLGPIFDFSGPAQFETPITGGFQTMYGRRTGWQMLPILHFIDSVAAGCAPLCTPEEGFHNTAVICAVEKSLESGQPEPVAALD